MYVLEKSVRVSIQSRGASSSGVVMISYRLILAQGAPLLCTLSSKVDIFPFASFVDCAVPWIRPSFVLG